MKRKNTLLKGFQARKMDKGGMFKPFNSTVNAGIGAASTLGSGLIDVLDDKDRFGTRSGAGAAVSGALKGAAAGAALGPAGLIGGAVIGAGVEFLGNKKAQKEKQIALTGEVEDASKIRDGLVDSRLIANPELKYGNTDAQMYKLGGTIKGKPLTKHYVSKTMGRSAGQAPDLMPNVAINPNKMIKFDTGGQTSGYGAFNQKTPFGTTGKKQWTPEEKAYVLKKTGMKENQINDNLAVVEKYLTQFRSGNEPVGSPPIDGNNRVTMNENGTTNAGVYNHKTGGWAFAKYKKGGLLPTSSTTATVKGKSHAEGGVKFPELGVELEGGETVAGDFVFSKELGFADIHEKLGKRMGANEKRPQTALNMKTAEAMKRKEGFIKIYQEQGKKEKGIPNEIDNSAEQMKAQQATGPTVMALGGTIDPEERRKEIKSRIDVLKKSNPFFIWDDPKIVDAPRTEYRKLLDENRKLITAQNAPAASRVYSKNTEVNPWASSSMNFGNTPIANVATVPVIAPTSPAAPAGSNLAPIRKAVINKGKVKATKVAEAPKKVVFPTDVMDPNDAPPGPIIPSAISGKIEEGSKAVQDMIEANKKARAETPSADASTGNGKVGDIIKAVAPFTSNLVNSFRKLPNPPKPTMDDTISPSLINLDASRAEATRTRRSADKTAAANLNANNTVAAVKAANMTQEIRATNEINQTEQNANAQIKNQAQQVNSQIARGNNLKTDFYNSQKLERQLKTQELSASNIADVTNKIQLQNRDNRLFELEDTKNLLTMFADPTGATGRAMGSTLDRVIKDPAARADVKKRLAELQKMDAEDRKAGLEALTSSLKAIGVTKDILNNTKALPVDVKFEKATLQNNFLKSKARN